MKNYLLFFLALPLCTFAQKKGDSKIVITVKNTDSLAHKVKQALTQTRFIVKEDGYKSVVSTYPKEFKRIPGFSMAKAEIKGNTIVLSGMYDISQPEDLSMTQAPKDYKPIIYYKGSHGWRLLMEVADKLNGQVSFAK